MGIVEFFVWTVVAAGLLMTAFLLIAYFLDKS